MSIQLLGLRSYTTKEGKTAKAEKFFDKKWRAASVAEVLKNHVALVEAIPAAERYNIYFTVAACAEKPGRELIEQTIIPFDIDGVNPEKVKESWFSVCKALGIIPEQSGALWSGHGLQLFVAAHEPISDASYFTKTRPYYAEVCAKINAQLAKDGLAGHADPAVWSPARLMRMPGTINSKPEKGLPDTPAYILSDNIEAVGFNFIKLSGIPVVPAGNQLSKAYLAAFPEADYKAILDKKTGCQFLVWTKEKPNDVSEDQWYAQLNITEHMPGGRELSHEYSRGYKGYSFHETERKAEQARVSSGPRTCSDISGRWPGCAKCPNYGKVKSPIQIKSEDFVETESTGFYKIVVDKDGLPKPGKPDVNGLVKHVKKTMPFKTSDGKDVYLWNGKSWVRQEDSEFFNVLAYKKFSPAPEVHYIRETSSKLHMEERVPKAWFREARGQKINLQNGVYDWQDQSLVPHDKEFGFTYCLPFDYTPDSSTPVFDSFLRDITCDREEYARLILEYMGYCLSGDNCWLQKCMILTGEGSNGKSTLMDLLRAMAGPESYSGTPLESLITKDQSRANIEHKLFNISSEAGLYSISSSEVFKALVSGDDMEIKVVFRPPYTTQNTAKLFISCNQLPMLNDTTRAIFRRLLIIPFDAVFDNDIGNRDSNLLKKLLPEISGIFVKCMDAYIQVKKNGCFTEGPLSREVLAEFKSESNVLETWFRENYNIFPVFQDDKFEFKNDIYTEYVQDCKLNLGVKPVSNSLFFRQLKPIIRNIKERHSRKYRDHKREHILIGIARKAEVSEF